MKPKPDEGPSRDHGNTLRRFVLPGHIPLPDALCCLYLHVERGRGRSTGAGKHFFWGWHLGWGHSGPEGVLCSIFALNKRQAKATLQIEFLTPQSFPKAERLGWDASALTFSSRPLGRAGALLSL